MRPDARAEHNRDVIEMWLVTRGLKVSTRPPGHPDEFHGNVNKPQSRPNQDLTWLEAISTPDARSTDAFLNASLRDLEHWLPNAYDVLHSVYTGTSSDPSLPERWRQELAKIDTRQKRRVNLAFLLHYLDDAFSFLVYRAHLQRRLLFWPIPEKAQGYVEKSAEKRRDARYHYLRERDADTPVTQAVRLAARRSGASEQAVWYWKSRQEWDGPKITNLQPNGKVSL